MVIGLVLLLGIVAIAAFIQPAEHLTGFALEAQQRRVAGVVVDFLVCEKSMKPLSAVQGYARIGKAAETAAFAAACVASTGLRWMEISPTAPPMPEDLRTLVLGE